MSELIGYTIGILIVTGLTQFFWNFVVGIVGGVTISFWQAFLVYLALVFLGGFFRKDE